MIFKILLLINITKKKNKTMRKTILIFTAIALIAGSCNQAARQKQSAETVEQGAVQGTAEKPRKVEDFLSSDEVVVKKIVGDLNGDGEKDVALLTKKQKNFDDCGLLIAFKKGNQYELAFKNPDCFLEYGLDIGIKNGNLWLSTYDGVSEYTFRYQKNDFELIGFDCYFRHFLQEDEGIDSETRPETTANLNFLTKKMKVRTRVLGVVDDEEVAISDNVTWHNIKVKKLVKLSDIKFFTNDIIDIKDYYTEKK